MVFCLKSQHHSSTEFEVAQEYPLTWDCQGFCAGSHYVEIRLRVLLVIVVQPKMPNLVLRL